MKSFPSFEKISEIMKGRIIILDTETTGLLNKQNHLLEVGAREVVDGCLTGNQFNCFIRPRVKIEETAKTIHKMDDSLYEKDYENFFSSDKLMMSNFLEFVRSSTIFAHNAYFDSIFINRELNHWKLKPISDSQFICTKKFFLAKFSNNPNLFNDNNNNKISKIINFSKASSLLNCCKFFNLEVDENRMHSALNDSLITFKILKKIIEKTNNFSNNPLFENELDNKLENPDTVENISFMVTRISHSIFSQEKSNIISDNNKLLKKKRLLFKTNCLTNNYNYKNAKSFLLVFHDQCEDNYIIQKIKEEVKKRFKDLEIFSGFRYMNYLIIFLKFFVQKKLIENYFEDIDRVKILEIITKE